MDRRTKIVATVGPASEEPHTLRAMIRAGMNMARLSLSHGAIDDTLARITRVREAAHAESQIVGVLADLPGPKIRAAEFPDGGVHLAEGTTVELVPAASGDVSTERRIAVELPSLLADLQRDDRVALGDGALQLCVTGVSSDSVVAEVLTGGWAQGRPGVAIPPGRTRPSSPTAARLPSDRIPSTQCERWRASRVEPSRTSTTRDGGAIWVASKARRWKAPPAMIGSPRRCQPPDGGRRWTPTSPRSSLVPTAAPR